MIDIQAPDGSIVQFPDGTSDDVIKRVMRREYGKSREPTSAFGKAIKSIHSAIPDLMPNDAFMHGAGQGATFGRSDEESAKLDAVLKGQDEATSLERRRRRHEQLSEEQPISYYAGLAAGGAMAPLMASRQAARAGAPAAIKALSPITAAAKNSWPVRALAGALEGGAYGAAHGAGAEKDGRRIQGATEGATLGAAIGGGVPVAGAALQGARHLVSTPQQINKRGAHQVFRQAIEESGLSPFEVAKRADEGVAPYRQASPMTALAEQVYAEAPGRTQQAIEKGVFADFAKGNNTVRDELNRGLQRSAQKMLANQSDDTSKALASIVREPNYWRFKRSWAQLRGDAAKPKYDAAFARNYATPPGNDFFAFFESLPAKALKEAKDFAASARRPFRSNVFVSIGDDSVRVRQTPSLEEAELVRRSLNDKANSLFIKGNGGEAANFRDMERELRAFLDDLSPELAAARSEYAEMSAIKKAAELGETLATKSLDEIEFVTEAMSPNELVAARRGLEWSLRNKLDNGSLRRADVLKIFGSNKNQGALQRLWPDQEDFARVSAIFSDIEQQTRAKNRVVGGSPTYRRQAQSESMGAGDFFAHAASGPELAATSVVGRAINKITSNKLPKEQLDELVNLLFAERGMTLRPALRALDRGSMGAERKLTNVVKRLLNDPAAQAILVDGSAAIASR
ncbi:MAG: hypothetical protein AAGH60_14655 [Pseudomonadota bacterium]